LHRRPPSSALGPLWPAPLLLAGCAVGPNYAPPASGAPAAWNALPAGAETRTEALGAWWEGFQDPVLSHLIRRATEGNLDLKVTVSRVDEARALYRAEAAAEYPAIDAQGSVFRQRASENLLLPGGTPVTIHSVSVSASWEIDLFGRVRRSVEAAGANVDASEENRRNVLVSISAQVASSYVNLRTVQRRLSVARENLASQAKIVDLTKIRREGGIASSLDVAQAESIYANTQTTIPPLEAFQGHELNRLGVLLGEKPAALWAELSPESPLPGLPGTLAVELPADLVRQRPDIRQAERELAAQTARIGVAQADFFPRVLLTGSAAAGGVHVGGQSFGPQGLFSLGPSVTLPIFNAGRVAAGVSAAEARAQAALAEYQQVVLGAFRDVSDGLVEHAKRREARVQQEAFTTAARDATRLANLRYTGGVSPYLEVLDSERQLFDAELGLVRIQRDELLAVVRLYKALGGGWQP